MGMSEIKSERQSSSTASNTTPHQSQDSDEPLDGASCSASFFPEITQGEIVSTPPKNSDKCNLQGVGQRFVVRHHYDLDQPKRDQSPVAVI